MLAENIEAALDGERLPEFRRAQLRCAAESALLGGRAAMAHYPPSKLSVEGSPTSPVTSADRASHRAILAYLQINSPDATILSEEGLPVRLDRKGGCGWIVDPLDGTREFIDQIGEFSVMIGLVEEGRAVLGAVYQPVPDVLYFGLTDQGAWRVEHPWGRSSVSRLTLNGGSPKGLRFVRSRSHPDRRLQALEEAVAPTEVIESGSVGTKCILIAEGGADLYVHPVPYLREWDTCAPEAVLRGAGGRVSDCRGEMLSYGKPGSRQSRGIFAAHPDVWRRIAPIVFHNGKDL